MRIISTVFLLMISFLSQAESTQASDVSNVLLKQNIVFRDSGKGVTEIFLKGCLARESQKYYVLSCDDILFKYHISFFERNSDKSVLILITEDGASVENRWVFQVKDGEYVDIKSKVWPNISKETISQLLVQQTGNIKYTTTYVSSVAHSSYRVSYTSTKSLIVGSGIPDQSYGVELGGIEWDGNKFNFVPKKS
jgi:hypothetical protein